MTPPTYPVLLAALRTAVDNPTHSVAGAEAAEHVAKLFRLEADRLEAAADTQRRFIAAHCPIGTLLEATEGSAEICPL